MNDVAWHSDTCSKRSPELLNALEQTVKLCDFIHLTVSTREFRAKANLVMVQLIAADYLFGTSFINHHVADVLPSHHRAVLYHSVSVFVIVQHFFSKL